MRSLIPIVRLQSARIVVTGGKQYSDIKTGFSSVIETLKRYFVYRVPVAKSAATSEAGGVTITQAV